MATTKLDAQIHNAVKALLAGKVIAYPTEAVYGLGCDPFNEHAVNKILSLKKRDASKGLILIASSWDQIESFVAKMPGKQVFSDWPGPITKVFPASDAAPKSVCAPNNTIALRLTDHPVAKILCSEFGGAIVSTSANPEGLIPAKMASQVRDYFPEDIEVIVDAPVGNLSGATPIIDAFSGERYRG